MDEKLNINGYIESFKGGFIRGWAVTTTELSQANSCNLYIDNIFICLFEANIYREDLRDVSLRGGVAGFLVPIPLSFCDSRDHTVTLYKSNGDILLATKKLKLSKKRDIIPLDENIVFDQINKPYANDKKLVFLAGFTNQATLLNYQEKLLQAFEGAGYYVVLVIASDTPEVLGGILAHTDRVVVRSNFGYDFGSWATVFQLCQKEFIAAEEVLWVNDSIIGPIGSMDELFKKIDASNADIWAITDSQDRQYHFQSYCGGLKKKANQFAPVIDAFFYYRYALPQDKEEAISHYELEALSFFKAQGLSVDILFPESDLISLAEELFLIELHNYSEKWQVLFDLPSIKRKTQLRGILKIADVFIQRAPTNSSHMYWNALLDNGFPFVKRELITLNPAQYPFPYQFRAAFEEHNATELLDDLAGKIELSIVL